MQKLNFLALLVSFLFAQNIEAQTTVDSTLLNKEFYSLEEALKNPENVYRLNLSNRTTTIPDTIWTKFPNLIYLSLKNDHLKELPIGIGSIKTLKVLDLSGNDFKVLPASFSNLINLQELYLNDEQNFQLEKSIPILSSLPNLRSLHLENDHLKVLPHSILKINKLESLYLNNNEFKHLPKEINELENLKYLDIHDNKLRVPNLDLQKQESGIKIRF